MKAQRVVILAFLTVILAAVVVAAQGEAPPEPGPPPPLDPGSAAPSDRWPPVQDPSTGEVFPVVCDANWCYIVLPPGMTPDLFEAAYLFGGIFPVGCWNSGGNICIVAPNSPEADQWLRDWAFYMYIMYGNGACVLLSIECAIPGWEPTITFPDQDNSTNDDNQSPTPAPTPTPRPMPTPRPTRQPTPPPTTGRPTPPPPSDAGCPPARYRRAQTTVRVDAAPNFPVVIGQDPREMGVVYTVTVTVPPVVYERWWKEPDRCEPVPDADGDGAPDREGNCTTWIGDPPVEWPGDLVPGQCRLQQFILPDPVQGSGRMEMVLRPASRRWIETELAAKYPGARVRRPEMRMVTRGRGYLRPDRTYVYRAVVNPKPVDPGIYDVTFLFRTRGTGVTRPLLLRKEIAQKVYLIETGLVK